ncbi:hypothetical protein [Limosilactobacillus vaginalis]|uniref:hypothetical protein n=1 Tax=Limosilactobacillus vaginalis TaxID=1633 RepID=UPI0025A416BB|nr:hypothetical protein [Limosilactobacillus vaginalis]MDM8243276.1 hypothetical protein [Limosilactobacillus vaginalis]
MTNQSIKIDSENDGSVTFTGKAEKDAVITIEKHNGNKHHYKVKPDANGNFTKRQIAINNLNKFNDAD